MTSPKIDGTMPAILALFFLVFFLGRSLAFYFARVASFTLQRNENDITFRSPAFRPIEFKKIFRDGRPRLAQ
jgi:hypothetical protein